MAKKKAQKVQEPCYSFVYTPQAPSCTRKDGSVDYEKYHEMLAAAKQGNHEAQKKIFEQHQGIWKSLSAEYKEKIEQSFMDWEDFQQEASVSTMVALKKYDDETYEKSYSDYFASTFRNNLIDIVKKESKQVNINTYLCSLEATDEEGRQLYQIPDTSDDYFKESYARFKQVLSDIEFKIIYAHYEEGLSLKTISDQFGLSYVYVKKLHVRAKEKVKILTL